MMTIAQVLEVLAKTLHQTKAGVVRWSKNGEDSFKADFARSSLVIWFDEGRNMYGFTLLNAAGESIGSATSYEATSARPVLEDLYRTVMAQYLNLDATLADIMKGLEGKSTDECPF
jgi:hypothetical protein